MNAGDRLNHYEIIGPLGAGGMGEVYVARDTKLDRRVALKILPEELARNSERRDRFEREAKAIAALNHANIVTIHSVEEATAWRTAAGAEGGAAGGPLHFLTMELVEGQTLAGFIPANGLGLGQFFDIAVPLADALSAAHQKGIAHRDLKPSNVMVTNEGKVKLLDFGLAKLFDEPGGGAGDRMATDQATAADREVADLTEEGKILGTIAYMSPEQAEGKPTDHRSDVFSLGIILYELATGRRPFGGDSKLSVMSSIVRDTPAPVTDVNADLPRDLGRIIKRALEKDVNRRFQTALDVRNELEDLRGDIESGEVLVSRPTAALAGAGARRRSPTLLLSIAALAATAIGVGWIVWWGGAESGGSPGLRVTTRAIAVSPTAEFAPAISPDGQWVVFSMTIAGPTPEGRPAGAPPRPDLFLQKIDGEGRINLTNTPLAAELSPQYSPDGSRIAYLREGNDGTGIYVMGALGESPRLLTRHPSTPSWSPDGTKIYIARLGFVDPRAVSGSSEILVIDVASGEQTPLFDRQGWTALQPSASPNGKRVAFWGIDAAGAQRDIWTIPAAGGDPVAVTDDRALDWSPIWSPDGRYLYFSSDRRGSMNIWRVAVDEDSGEALAPPEPLTSGGLGDQGLLSISADGTRLVYTDLLQRSQAMRAAFDADTLTVANDGVPLSGPVRVAYLHPSPDGRRLAYISVGGQQDLYVANLDGTGERQLTDDLDKSWGPRWLNDSETLVFVSDRGDAYDVWSIRADGSERARLGATPPDELTLAPSPDGRRLAVSQRGVDQTPFLELVGDPSTLATTLLPPIPETGGRLLPFDWSPGGDWLAGSQQGVVLYHPATGAYRRLTDRGDAPRFTPDGTRIIYRISDGPFSAWWMVDLETLEQRVLTVPLPTISDLWLLRDGRHVAYIVQRQGDADVWLLEIEEGARR